MKSSTQEDYKNRIVKLQLFIEKNLYTDLSLKQLAEEACFSEFHFHRIFTAFTGESVSSYIRRLRLERTAKQLWNSKKTITQIAMESGYETPASFAKAFKKDFGVTPSEYREKKRKLNKKADRRAVYNKLSKGETMTPDIRIIDTVKVISVRKTGSYSTSAELAWAELMKFAQAEDLLCDDTMMIGIGLDSPDVTDEEKLRYDACISVKDKISTPGNIMNQEIEGGYFAVFLHKGPYENLKETYHTAFGSWLPSSGKELRNSLCFERYLNDPKSVVPDELLTEIYLPIQ